MVEKLLIALVQFSPVWESPSENREYIEKLLLQLPLECDIVVLPEAFTTGFSMDAEKVAEGMDGETLQWMKRISAEKNIALCGSLFIQENNHYYNRFCWVQPEGVVLTYDKCHLFSFEKENRLYTKGNKQLQIDFKGWKLFIQICYDLRFPVWSRNTTDYDLLINVANWPAARNEVWKTLLKARAIENQCYVVAVNRIGTDGNNIEHSGNSLVIDPKGIKIFKAHHREMIETVTLDYEQLHQFRKKFDTLKDRDQFIITN